MNLKLFLSLVVTLGFSYTANGQQENNCKAASKQKGKSVTGALGIQTTDSSLCYPVQQFNQEDFLKVKDVNFINALNGKAAGVVINPSSSGVGGASQITIRGTKGFSQTSNVLYVVDGIPMFNLMSGGSSGIHSNGSTDPIADLNPEDIESLTVLTGATAAALYGSHASNGAIIINTKKGKAGKTSITVSSQTVMINPLVMPRFQNTYGSGNIEAGIYSGSQSWGERFNAGTSWNYSPQDNYFRTGIAAMESASLSTGTQQNQTYLSAAATNSRGIIPNNGYDRYNLTFRNTTRLFDDKLRIDLGAEYIYQKDRNRLNQGLYSNPLIYSYLLPRGSDWTNVQMYERYDPERQIMVQNLPQTMDGLMAQNPYWANYRNLLDMQRDRYALTAAASYQANNWLTVSARLRMDNTGTNFSEKYYASSDKNITNNSENGFYGVLTGKEKQTYGDLILKANHSFASNWTIQAALGGSFSHLSQNYLRTSGGIANYNAPNSFELGMLDPSLMSGEEYCWKQQYQSVFASADLGFKNTYFLHVTGRNDWQSQTINGHTLNATYLYPSVGASVILSEIIPFSEQISFLKLRASYASVGMATPYQLTNRAYTHDNPLSVYSEAEKLVTKLNPERTNSFEAGISARFLRYFNVDFTYYNALTSDQLLMSPYSSEIYAYRLTGSVRNSGFELALGFENQWGKLNWRSDYVLNTNCNAISKIQVTDSYGHSLKTDAGWDAGGLNNARFLLKEGGNLGDLYSLTDLRKDSKGYIHINENGSPEVTKDTAPIHMGSVLPKANMGWRNNFTYANFNLDFLFTARIGGIVYSATQAVMDEYGVSETTADARQAGGIVLNSDNDRISAQKWYTALGSDGGVPQYNTYDATNIRLQELSIGYTIPRKYLGNVLDMTISLVGRNLWMIYCKAPFDPEMTATTGNFYRGIDYFMMPSTRNVGLNLRFKF